MQLNKIADMTVWLIQCLCPKRHCILAAALEQDAPPTEAPLRSGIQEAMTAGELNPWCGLCHAGSDTWVYEVKPTGFATMDEAMPTLIEAQARNIATGVLQGELSPKSSTRH